MDESASAIVLASPAVSLAAVAPELASARSYAAASRAENTRRAYASDLAKFGAWCEARGLCPLPAEPSTVAAYYPGRGLGYTASTKDRPYQSASPSNAAQIVLDSCFE
jgi:hypothetical protein